jgi:hypothetical protein
MERLTVEEIQEQTARIRAAQAQLEREDQEGTVPLGEKLRRLAALDRWSQDLLARAIDEMVADTPIPDTPPAVD